MADDRAIHGKNAKIIIDGTDLEGPNAWDISLSTDAVETDDFGDVWKANVPGISSASGSISGWQWQNKRVLMDAVTGQAALTIFLYPDSDDLTNYWTCSAVFGGYSGSGSTSAAVAGSATWVSDGTLTATGFA